MTKKRLCYGVHINSQFQFPFFYQLYTSHDSEVLNYYVFLSSRHMYLHSSGDSPVVTREKIDQGRHKILSSHTRNALVMPKYCTAFPVAPSLYVKNCTVIPIITTEVLSKGERISVKAFPSIAVPSRMGPLQNREAHSNHYTYDIARHLPCCHQKRTEPCLSALLSLRCETITVCKLPRCQAANEDLGASKGEGPSRGPRTGGGGGG